MGDSYRLRTQVGINQTINVQLDQEFEFLEILSLKIQQSDIYTRSCADYGVLVGRVIANNGFGIPNAKVSVFIPLSPIDESNPIITSIYPYKSPQDRNEDGFRYNLLPYEKSYPSHSPTGTFPSRLDVLTGNTAVDIYDRYYKFTTKTNSSGDYMIMGVPLGSQSIVMDLDLSDIGEFSLTPQDLIRMGLANESQVNGSEFRTSEDLNSLPQIINITKNIEVSPLWGDPSICQIAINRLDFDLRDELNIDIQPTAVFIGSIFSSSLNNRVRPGSLSDSVISSKMGSLCNLETGPGQILSIRQTIQQDKDGNPILEVYGLGNSGNLIDGDGTWMVELPMNLEYISTNEFGERVVSTDGTVGIPTKGKYRFKIKWKQPTNNSQQKRRAYFLVPNVREYGWDLQGDNDPNFETNFQLNSYKQLRSSYYFGLDWTGYTNGITSKTLRNEKLNQIIDCQDTFYEFSYNRVYTVSNLIDQFKSGGIGSFVGIKEIQDQSCSETTNKFPVNEAYPNPNADINRFITQINALYTLYARLIWVLNILLAPIGSLLALFGGPCIGPIFKLPMITYPECEECQCDATEVPFPDTNNQTPPPPEGILTQFSNPQFYVDSLTDYFISQGIQNNVDLYVEMASDVLASNSPFGSLKNVPKSRELYFGEEGVSRFAYSVDLPLAERINVFNGRKNYFDGINKIKVSFNTSSNVGVFHYDNCLVIITNEQLTPGDMLTVNNPNNTGDVNFLGQGIGVTYDEFGNPNGDVEASSRCPGTTIFPNEINVSYAESQTTSQTVSYVVTSGFDYTQVSFPSDVEYFQVIYSSSIPEVEQLWDTSTPQSFPNVLSSSVNVVFAKTDTNNTTSYKFDTQIPFQSYKYFQNIEGKYVTILQRGVDPYSPKYPNKYSLGKIFGLDMDDLIVEVDARLNIPIQPLPNTNLSVQVPSQNGMMYPSYFFQPQPWNPETLTGYLGFTTIPPINYGSIDADYNNIGMNTLPLTNGVLSKVTKTNNVFWSFSPQSTKYDSAEDLSGVGFLYGDFPIPGFNQNFTYSYINMLYYSPIFVGAYQISNPNKTIIRTDRLPSSDNENEFLNTNINKYPLLQQNQFFRMYVFTEDNEIIDITQPGDIRVPPSNPQDIDGLPGSQNILDTLQCENMVSIKCYEGFGETFSVNPNCAESDRVEKGCYIIGKCLGTPRGIINDLNALTEWRIRKILMYSICNGFLSESFTNNWINGTLFMFPIQINKNFTSNNTATYKYPRNVTFFDDQTNNLYYRSSPYHFTALKKEFVGKNAENIIGNINNKNLLFPTTIVDLGFKSEVYSEIIPTPDTKAYVVNQLDSTSYGDNTDLVNLFAISRLTNASFWANLSPTGVLGALFNRYTNVLQNLFNSRVDADFAQLSSINSEVGNIDFTSDFYTFNPSDPNNSTIITGTSDKPVMGVWFSSTTEDLQIKDFMTPGKINFTADNGSVFPYTFGIKSQVVPMYRWKLKTTSIIFGNQQNDWITSKTDGNGPGFVAKPYQSLDRETIGEYFVSNIVTQNEDKRGYIFSRDANGDYSLNGANGRDKFIVGAPFHFYFGIKKGFSAFDKFSQKYLPSEEI